MKTLTKFALALAPALLMAACGGGDDGLADRLDIADPKVRLVHAVPLGPDVSLFRNELTLDASVSGLAYKGASNYFDVATTTAKWEVRTTTTPALPIGSVTFDARRGNKYTLLAVPDSGNLTEVAFIEDPYNKEVTSNNARVRVFNASANAASYDVYMTGPSGDISAVAPDFPAVGYKQAVPASGSDSTDLGGGVYRLVVTTAGTKTVIFTAPVDLAKNADWLLTSVPASVAPNDLRMLVIKSDGGAPATELFNTP